MKSCLDPEFEPSIDGLSMRYGDSLSSLSSVEPFWDLKISKYVTRVSSEYLLTASYFFWQAWLIELLGLCNPSVHYMSTIYRSKLRKLYFAVKFIFVIEASKFVTFKVESRSQTGAHAPSVNTNVGQHHSYHHRYMYLMRNEGCSVTFHDIPSSNLLFCSY